MSSLFAPEVKVIPPAPTVLPVLLDPPFTVIAFIASVLPPVPSCLTNKVNVAVPEVGTFVKSISYIIYKE